MRPRLLSPGNCPLLPSAPLSYATVAVLLLLLLLVTVMITYFHYRHHRVMSVTVGV